MHIIDKTMNDLLDVGIIPNTGNFEITEDQLYAYIKAYQLNKNSDGNNFEYILARKLAGLSFIKLKLSRGIKASEIKEGFIYLIKNPAWPEHIKIGMSINVKTRLSTYQTSDPFRKYSVSNYDFVLDRNKTEKDVLDKFSIDIEKGEWTTYAQSTDIIRYVRSFIKYPARAIKYYDVTCNKPKSVLKEYTKKSNSSTFLDLYTHEENGFVATRGKFYHESSSISINH